MMNERPPDSGFVRHIVLALCIGLALAFGGCASTPSRADAPIIALPLGATEPVAYTEAFLAAHPRAALRPGHLALLSLEPAGVHEGDTGTAEGMDAVHYFVDRPVRLRLHVAAPLRQAARMALRDGEGRVLGEARADSAMTVSLAPGFYLLEVHHLQKSNMAARSHQVFVRASDEGEQTAERVTTLELTSDCLNCDFSHSNLSGQRFDGINLSGSKFVCTGLLGTTFIGAVMQRTLFKTDAIHYCFNQATDADFTNADLTSAQFEGFYSGNPGGSVTFRNARLNATVWTPPVLSPRSCDGVNTVSIYDQAWTVQGDFQGADVSYARFTSLNLSSSDFSGANLHYTDFSSSAAARDIDCRQARTLLRGVKFRGPLTRFEGTAFANADLTGADLSDASVTLEPVFSVGLFVPGAILSGINLSSTVLRTAELVIQPSDALNGQDLAGANFSGFNFAKMDLTRTDFTGATLSAAALATLAAARLSDGTAHGVVLTDLVFSDGFTAFRGKDLSYADLSGSSLVQADLTDATLAGTKLTGTRLVQATLNGADLARTDLSRAVLWDGISAAQFPSFASATLSDGMSHGVNLSGQTFPDGYTALQGKDLSYADLGGVKLPSALLVNAKLAQASLRQAMMSGASLNGATLAKANLNQAVLNDAQLKATDLSNAGLFGAQLHRANLEGANLYRAFLANNSGGSIFNSASLVQAHLKNVNLSFAELSGVNFSFANLYGDNPASAGPCNTASTNYQGFTHGCASVHGAILTDTTFASAYLYGVDFTAAAIAGVDFSQAVLTAANFSGATLSGFSQSGKATTFSRAHLQGANLQTAVLECTNSPGCYDFTYAFVDFRSGGNNAYVLLDGFNHNSFAGCPIAASSANTKPLCNQDVCVFVSYPSPTTVPAVSTSITCPDGSAEGCGPQDGSSRHWASPLSISRALPPAWYDQDATYTKAPADSSMVCAGKGAGAAVVLW